MSCDIRSEGVQLLATDQGLNSRDADSTPPRFRLTPRPRWCGEHVRRGSSVAGEPLCPSSPPQAASWRPEADGRGSAEARPAPALRNALTWGPVPAAAPRAVRVPASSQRSLAVGRCRAAEGTAVLRTAGVDVAVGQDLAPSVVRPGERRLSSILLKCSKRKHVFKVVSSNAVRSLLRAGGGQWREVKFSVKTAGRV